MNTAIQGRRGSGTARARRAGHRHAQAAEAPQFRRSRLSEALLGALLALQAPAAMASVCATGVIVNQFAGTGTGSLYNAFNNKCVEFSTSMGNNVNAVRLDAGYTMTQPYTLYFDTAGTELSYMVSEGTGASTAGSCVPTSFRCVWPGSSEYPAGASDRTGWRGGVNP